MATQQQQASTVTLPSLPAKHVDFITHLNKHSDTPMLELVAPYNEYDAKLREIFAQHPNHPAILEPNVVPLFAGQEQDVKIRARNLNIETEAESERYIMPLKPTDRKPNGSGAIVGSLKTFQTNFQLFSESSLVDMDWSNVVVAGSAVVTSLLPVPDEHGESKRSLREYYHQKLAPASDVDLFLYGLTEDQAIEKIKQIEQRVRDSILTETTTVRTKNAITIVSQYPTRHVQIVLRIYRSISEVLTGFDVDCACAAYDGKQVYASPRALAAYMTQINTIDLTRRSPSYENRLSKYSHRGFEIYWPQLDRSRLDPTIFERSFGRTLGLARLLVLEKLPKNTDREAYVDQRRAERGRPAINRWGRRALPGNMKEEHDDEVAEWEDGDQISDYNTFTIPYGPKYHARKIERLLYAKDLLLNAEWNRPKDRETTLHRHPAFFGSAEKVIGDCCGCCPAPQTSEDEDIAEEERKIYVSGELTFLRDDPGRQAIGSFNPLTVDDWTDMAYVGNTARLCQAIVDKDLEGVKDWLGQDSADPNTRDYTGRTPLQLAVISSTPEIVQCLIDAGVRLVARLVDGKTALHLTAMRGEAAMVNAILAKSEANEEIEAEIQAARRKARRNAANEDEVMPDASNSDARVSNASSDSNASSEESGACDDEDSVEDEDDDIDMVDDESDNIDATTENSIVKIGDKSSAEHEHLPDDTDADEPDIYDVDVLAWDIPASALHFAIVNGHMDVVKVLVQDFGADVMLPIKLLNDYNKRPRAAILPLVLAAQLAKGKAEDMTKLLIDLGASPAQADVDHFTALQYVTVQGADILQAMIDANRPAAQRAVNHISMKGYQYSPQMHTAMNLALQSRDIACVEALLELGAKPDMDYGSYTASYKTKWDLVGDSEHNEKQFRQNFTQPILTAVEEELPAAVLKLLDAGADINTLNTTAWRCINQENHHYQTPAAGTLLDAIRNKMKDFRTFIEDGKTKTGDPFFGGYGYNQATVKPLPLKDDHEYLQNIEPQTYAYWSISKQIEDAKIKYTKELKEFEKASAAQKVASGSDEKKAAIKLLLDEFEHLESELVRRDAKSFQELYPDLKPQEQVMQSFNSGQPPKREPWEPKITCVVSDLTDERREAYARLFQAAWTGDLPSIKALTLSVWKEDQSPLQIAVMDNIGFSPFAIAVLRKHVDVAKAILVIAHAQWAPDEAEIQKYSLQPSYSDSEDSSADSDDEFELYSEIVDDRFTIENIGEVEGKVKSKVTPLELLSWNCPASRFLDDDDASASSSTGHNSSQNTNFGRYGHYRRQLRSAGRSPYQVLKHARNMRSYETQWVDTDEYFENVIKPGNLFQLAIFLDDIKMLRLLISLGEQYSRSDHNVTNDAQAKFYRYNDRNFFYAIRLGRLQLLEEIILRTGAGIPLDDLVKKSGVQVQEAPKYYQGLSVHGKKRADWANAGRDQVEAPALQHPPLLHAARLGNIDSVDWFVSDAAQRCYVEFMAEHSDDKRVQSLSQSKDGIDASISAWLNLRSKLIMHCVILGKTDENSLDLLRNLCKRYPDLMEQKSSSGLTPLHLAFSLHRIEMIKILIEAGADQTCRNKDGDNIVHSAVMNSTCHAKNYSKQLRSVLNQIDGRLLSSLFAERTSSNPGAATPLARWLSSFGQSHGGYNGGVAQKTEETLKVLLHFSKGEDLSVINGEGDTPIHASIRCGATDLLQTMLDCRPGLLYRENGTGRTPFEMAEDAYLSQDMFSNPPSLPNNHGNHHYGHYRYGQRSAPIKHTRPLLRQPQTFVGEAADERSNNEKIWDLCKQYAVTGGSTKRKLVSLTEAGEVARRLASNKKRRDAMVENEEDGGREDDAAEEAQEEVKGDEVNVWFEMAKGYA